MKIKPWIIFLIVIPIILFIFRELKTPITSSTPAAITSTSKLSRYCDTEGIDVSKCFNNLDLLLENEEKKAKQKKSSLESQLNGLDPTSLIKYYALDGSIVGHSNYGRKTNVKLKSFTDLPKEPNKQFFQSNYIIRGVLEFPVLSYTEAEKKVFIMAEHDYENYSPPLGLDRSENHTLYIEEFGFASRDFDALEECESEWSKKKYQISDAKNHSCYGEFLISFVPMEMIKFDDTKEAGNYFIGSSFEPTLEAYSIKAKSIETQVANQLSQGKKYVEEIFQEHHKATCVSKINEFVNLDTDYSDGVHINTECSKNTFLSQYILSEDQYTRDENASIIINDEIYFKLKNEINDSIKCPQESHFLNKSWVKKERSTKEKIKMTLNKSKLEKLNGELALELDQNKKNEILKSIKSLKNEELDDQIIVSYIYTCE